MKIIYKKRTKNKSDNTQNRNLLDWLQMVTSAFMTLGREIITAKAAETLKYIKMKISIDSHLCLYQWNLLVLVIMKRKSVNNMMCGICAGREGHSSVFSSTERVAACSHRLLRRPVCIWRIHSLFHMLHFSKFVIFLFLHRIRICLPPCILCQCTVRCSRTRNYAVAGFNVSLDTL